MKPQDKRIRVIANLLVKSGEFDSLDDLLWVAFKQFVKREDVRTKACKCLFDEGLDEHEILVYFSGIGDPRLTGKCIKHARTLRNCISSFVDKKRKGEVK